MESMQSMFSRIDEINSRINSINQTYQTNKKEDVSNTKKDENKEDLSFSEVLDSAMKEQDTPKALDTSAILMDALEKTTKENKTTNTPGYNDNAYKGIIDIASKKYKIDPELLYAIIKTESGFSPNAVSPVGAEGLMQLMPETAKMLGVEDSFDPRQNILGGAKYLRVLMDRYGQDIVKSLAAYNAGPTVVDKVNGVPNYKETQSYVSSIVSDYYHLMQDRASNIK